MQAILSSHVNINPNRTTKCRVCDKIVNDLSTLERHMELHNRIPCYTCAECGTGITVGDTVKSPSWVNTSERLLVCFECGKGIACSSGIGILTKKQTVGKYGDNDGNENAVSRGSKDANHKGINKYSGVGNDLSEDFDAFSLAGDSLDQGMAQISLNKYGKVKLQPEEKEEEYHAFLVAKSRKFSHEKDQTWSVCTKKFTTQEEKTDTWRICTKLFSIRGEPSLVCQICRKFFLTENELKIHKSMHLQEEVYKCSQCDKPFRDKRSLKLHEQSHRNQKSFLCNVCNKGYPDLDALKAHVKVHSSVKPITNTILCKKFTEKGITKRHLVYPTDEKSYVCSICGLAFKQKQQLVKHTKCHANNVCKICQQVFKSETKLRKHMTFHPPENQYICRICGKGFGNVVSLEKHAATQSCRKRAVFSEASKDGGIDIADDIGDIDSQDDESDIGGGFDIGKISPIDDGATAVESLVDELQESHLSVAEPLTLKNEIVVENLTIPVYVKEDIPSTSSSFSGGNKVLICNTVGGADSSNVITLIIDKPRIHNIN
ncbi:hypothetical protein SK128_013583 [Halocaridina rubra]|uniref:C2H2-type domain-containing protein n=1 Tax=Halocaridina rubra TaxID=373956 RepID=A0AAN8WZY4_HALRR